MRRSKALLVNPNRMLPPIAPLGLEYIAHDLEQHGYEPILCDLTFEPDWQAALSQALSCSNPLAIGVSIRNLDDAYFASQDFILEKTGEIIRHLQTLSRCPMILGGCGFSIAPEATLCYTNADYGIVGDGEGVFPKLLDRIAAGESVTDIPGVVFRADGNTIGMTPPSAPDLARLSTSSRRFVNQSRYFQQGGQAGLETKRGCAMPCIYCVDPLSKGKSYRLRPPEKIVEEFRNLLEQGINVFHLCDSEFNLPPQHARAVCYELISTGIAAEMKWYAYACPSSFDEDLALTMAKAGCVGLNFGVDHGDDDMLRYLGRKHRREDIRRVVQACRTAGLALMFDLLLGAPGETRRSIEQTIHLMQELKPDRVGLSCGVRIYPGTPLAQLVRSQGPLEQNPNLHGALKENEEFLRPIFYVESAIGEDIHALIASLVNGDERFLFADPSQLDRNYNYNDNTVLSDAIRSGMRGAYWDILRKVKR